MLTNGGDEHLIYNEAEDGYEDDPGEHRGHRIESQAVGREVDAVGRHHIKCRMGKAYNSGCPEN